MIFEDLAVEVQEAFFKALEVAVVDCRDVGGDIFGEHDVQCNNVDSRYILRTYVVG
jgi:hypothetical protein